MAIFMTKPTAFPKQAFQPEHLGRISRSTGFAPIALRARKILKCFSFELLLYSIAGLVHFWISRHSRQSPKRRAFWRWELAEVANLSGIKVMIIDDSNTIRRSAEIFLVQAGCQVVLAEDGFDALAKIADHQPSVIFCDIMMPRLDGYQTCALIKKNQRFRNTPLIMLSSKDGLFDRARGRMVGSDQYLTKPFTKDSLLQAVATFAPPPA